MAKTSAELLGLVAGILVFLGAILAGLIYHPASPLPDHWNPTKPLIIRDPFTPVSNWKLRQLEDDFAYCRKFLEDLKIRYTVLPDTEVSENCHIRNQVALDQIGATKINTLNTSCKTALRLALWEFHSLQPLAVKQKQSSVQAIQHQGSYSCRKIRTEEGEGTRFSQHATASAIDIKAITLANGQTLSLNENWEDSDGFLKHVRNGACPFFSAVLSPDFNSLHTDHFHFDLGRYRTCQ